MRSWTNTLRKAAVVGAAIAITAACIPAHGSGCRSPFVIVEFSKPLVREEQFTIRLRTEKGDKDVTVKRNAAGTAWEAQVDPFDVASSMLLSADIDGVRTSCNVAPEKNFKVGIRCAAKYRVDCDRVWDMKVASTREGEAFGYRLQSPIAACDLPADFQTVATPRSILDIGSSDKVIVKVQRRQSFISVAITQRVLETFGGTARLSQLDPLPTTEAPVTTYTRYLKQAQADKNRDLMFSLAGAPAGGGR